MYEKEEIENLRRAIGNMAAFFSLPSGTTPFQLRLAAYYAASTWFLEQFQVFPMFVLYGNSGCGKTSLLDGLGEFCYKPVTVNISAETEATFRETLSKTNDGTAIIEESEDSTTSDKIEAFIKGRYSRKTGIAHKMIPTKSGSWAPTEYHTFGATIIHRRDHFNDQATESRCIYLPIQFNGLRSKSDYQSIPDMLAEGPRRYLDDARSTTLPSKVTILPDNIMGRVADTYDPILKIAQLLDDKPFIQELIRELQFADAAFRHGQTYSPKALVFKALLACMEQSGALDLSKSVCVERNICQHLRSNYMQGLTPNSAAKLLRELGFVVKQSGGVNKVMGITISQLANAAREAGVEDELLSNLISKGP
ncbi:MAG: hypothetical protein GY845_27615 [Planctomycetes bacterium]|nr:hypothetical protein [Planctomycetota bacterium]